MLGGFFALLYHLTQHIRHDAERDWLNRSASYQRSRAQLLAA
jgi:hypothetical protein